MTERDHPTLTAQLLQLDPTAYLDDNDHVIVKKEGVQYVDGNPNHVEYELDYTKLFQTAPKKTGHVSHLVIEAELLDEHGSLDNPAIPVDQDTEDAARRRIEDRDLTPAWEADA